MQDLLLTIDAMMYNKMNIFHWHVVDEDSFPLELESHPELSEHGAFSVQETYSPG
jgi:hexosaminidase